jgi:hypothetical protein
VVEQLFRKQQVLGSSPSVGSTLSRLKRALGTSPAPGQRIRDALVGDRAANIQPRSDEPTDIAGADGADGQVASSALNHRPACHLVDRFTRRLTAQTGQVGSQFLGQAVASAGVNEHGTLSKRSRNGFGA